MGPGSTPGHKTRPAAGRWAVCTERHQNTSLPNTSKIGRGGGSTVELLLPEHCCCYGGKPGCLWRPFWLFSTYKKQGGSKKYFFCKKRAYGGTTVDPHMPIFLYEKSFFGPAGFSTAKNSQKVPQTHLALLPLLQQCSGNGISTATTVDPHMPIFFYEKNFFRPSLIFRRQEQPKRRPKPPGLASIATAVLWQQYFNCHNRGRIERN